MAYSRRTLARAVYEALAARGPVPPSLQPRIVPLIPAAIDRLGEKLASGEFPEWAESQRVEFTVTAAAGEVDISSLYADGLVPSALKLAKVYQGDDTQASEWLPDRQAVALMAREGFPVVAREGSTLVFGDSDGGVGTLADDVVIRAVALPVESDGSIDWVAPAESALIDELVGMLTVPEKQERHK